MVVRKKEQGGKEEWRKVAKRWQAGWKGGREQGGNEGEQGKTEEAGWKGDREKSRKEGGSRVKRKVGE